MLTRAGCEFPIATLSPELEKRIRKELHVVPYSPVVSNVGGGGGFDLFKKTSTRYIVPHFWGLAQDGVVHEETRSPGLAVSGLGQFQGTLRPEQRALVAQVQKNFGETAGGSVLCARTGQGKTCMALYIASILKRKTVVIVHKAFLAAQWAERIKTFLPQARVSLYGIGNVDFSGDIVIATMQTILSRGVPYTFELENSVGFVIIDEVHRIAAPSFSKALIGLNAPFILGLSATPERADRLTRVLHWLCGPLVTSVSNEGRVDQDVTVIRATYPKPIADIPQNRRGDVDHATLITQLAEDDERTAFVVQTMLEHVSRDADCLVLSHRRVQCVLLAECLRQKGYDAATYLGGDKQVPSAKLIIATYSLVSEGFDEPRLATLVFATPASNITQAVGRILRAPGPKMIVDIIDKNPVSYAQASKRRAYYASAGYLGKQTPNVYMFRD